VGSYSSEAKDDVVRVGKGVFGAGTVVVALTTMLVAWRREDMQTETNQPGERNREY